MMAFRFFANSTLISYIAPFHSGPTHSTAPANLFRVASSQGGKHGTELNILHS